MRASDSKSSRYRISTERSGPREEFGNTAAYRGDAGDHKMAGVHGA